jgi:hypothetical protein
MENNPKKSKALIITFIVVLLLLIGVYLLFSNSEKIFGTKGALDINKIFSPLLGTSKNTDLETIDFNSKINTNFTLEDVCLNGTTNPPLCTTIAGSCINGTDNTPLCTTIGGKCQNSANNPPICTTKSLNGKNVCLNGATNPDKCTTKIIKGADNKNKEVCLNSADNVPNCTTIGGKCQNGANNPDVCTTIPSYNPSCPAGVTGTNCDICIYGGTFPNCSYSNPYNPNDPNYPPGDQICPAGLEGSSCNICSNNHDSVTYDPLACNTVGGKCTNTATNPDDCNNNGKTCLYGGTFPDKCNPMPKGTLSNNTNCIVAVGTNSCNIPLHYKMANISGPSQISTTTLGATAIVANITPNNTTFEGTTTVEVKYTKDVTFPNRKFTLRNQGTLLDEITIRASCSIGSYWNGSICKSDNIPPPKYCSNNATNYPDCNVFLYCTNNAVNYPDCTVFSDGSCVNGDTNPPSCTTPPPSGSCIYPKIKDTTVTPNTCINKEDCNGTVNTLTNVCENSGDNPIDCGSDPLEFTDAEYKAMQDLLKKYYRIADIVKSENDLITAQNDIDKTKSLLTRVKTLTAQCYIQTGWQTGYEDFYKRNEEERLKDPKNKDYNLTDSKLVKYNTAYVGNIERKQTTKLGHDFETITNNKQITGNPYYDPNIGTYEKTASLFITNPFKRQQWCDDKSNHGGYLYELGKLSNTMLELANPPDVGNWINNWNINNKNIDGKEGWLAWTYDSNKSGDAYSAMVFESLFNIW